ncbi:MAG: hypothetical protein H7Z37_05625 [Pyrinomonadaceae bacterium]|nr:hypothetical protein [Pyrinomonadaceae bacterium]
MANATAGRFYSNEIINLTKTLAIITDELRYQYRLGFYPLTDEKAGTSHEIKIKVSRPEVVVRARQTYRVTDKKSSK